MDLRNPQRFVVLALLLWLCPMVFSVISAQPLPYYKTEKVLVGETWLKNINTIQAPRVLKHPTVGTASFNQAGRGYLLTYRNKGIAEYDTIVFTADGEIHAYAIKNQFIKSQEDYFITTAGQTSTLRVLDNDQTYSNIQLSDIPFEEGVNATIEGKNIRLTAQSPGLYHFFYTACDKSMHCDEAKVTVFVMDPAEQAHTIVLSEVLEQQLTLPLPHAGYQLVYSTIDNVYPDGNGYFNVDLFLRDMGQNEIMFRDSDGKSLLYKINFIDKWGENRLNTGDKVFLHPGKTVEVTLTNNDFWLNVYSVLSTSSDIQVKRTGGGKVEIKPRPGFYGKASFKYISCAYPRCDTTTVDVFVDHFQPARDQFDFYVDPSVAYPIPFFTPNKDYQLSIVKQPDQGILTVNSHGHSLVYTPSSGFKGQDKAKIKFSYQTENGIFESQHYIRFLPSPFPFRGNCTDCVWPGDTDQNGVVDLADVEPIARYIGESGPPRPEGSVWKKQWSYPWLNFEGNDIHHTDADGDGIVALADLQVISDYYGNTHGLYADPVTWMDVPVVIVRSKDGVAPREDIIFEFNIGDKEHKLFNVTGFSTEVKIEGQSLTSSQVEVIRDEENWLKSHQPTMSLKAPADGDGQVVAGEFRARSVGVKGFGTALKLRIIVEDEVEGFRSLRAKSNAVKFIFRNLKLHTQNGVIQLPDQEIEIPWRSDEDPADQIPVTPSISPNPARDEITLVWPTTDAPIRLMILDMTGKQYNSYELEADTRGAIVPIDHLSSGVYILRSESGDNVWNQKLTVVE